MADMSRKQFLGLGAMGAAGLAMGCRTGTLETSVIAADLVVLNARVLTQDDAQPVVEAFAVRDGRFAAVGRSDDVRNLVSAGRTQVIDAAGACIVLGGRTVFEA